MEAREGGGERLQLQDRVAAGAAQRVAEHRVGLVVDAVDDREQQRLLGGVVVVDRAGRQVAGVGELADGRAGVAALVEEREAGLVDALARARR